MAEQNQLGARAKEAQREAERAVEELRKRFAPLVHRLSPEIEPAVAFSCGPAKAMEPDK